MRSATRTILLIFVLLALPLPCFAAADMLILSSSDIIQFSTCIEGIRSTLSDVSLQQITIDKSVRKGRAKLEALRESPPRAIIAVGTQATQALAETDGLAAQRVFCMVLDPEKLFSGPPPFPGVSLNIPPGFQLTQIKSAFPGRSRVGIFFSPDYNRATMDDFAREAAARRLELVRLPIASEKDIAAIINSDAFRIDVLLIIPDRSLRSPRIIEYIIKESLKKKIPAVGYNSWFAQNGALLSLIIDYEAVGRQTGALARQLMAGPTTGAGPDSIRAPETIRISVDAKTAEKLGIAVAPAIIERAHEVIR